MVSEKMIEAVTQEFDLCEEYNGTYKDLAQTVVNAAWNKFDGNDADTFPQQARPLLCIVMGGGVLMLSCFKYNGRYGWWDSDMDIFDSVTHYADPQDLMFKGD